VVHACNPTYWEAEVRRIVVQCQPRPKKKKSEILSQKVITQKKKKKE
jgi:hypothetical protein